MSKATKLTAYDSRDRATTDYQRAVGWAHSDKTLPRHGGGCSATWKGIGPGMSIEERESLNAQYLKNNAEYHAIMAKRMRKEREAGK